MPSRRSARPVGRRRLRRTGLGTFVLLLTVLSAGCPAEDHTDAPGPPGEPAGAAAGCAFPTAAGVGVVGGPLGAPEENAQTWGLARPGAGLQDAAVIELRNDGVDPVLLEEVRLTPEPGASPVRLAGAYVARGRLRFRPVGADPPGPELAGHCLPPRSARRPPILVLRIGPSLAGDVEGRARSMNNNVNLVYRTADGVRHVAVYSTRFSYPNLHHRPGRQ